MFSLSLCMIVKDEEDVIDRVLACSNRFADEIIIVDTGSKDKTKEICKNFTDKIYDFVWCDNFSLARNFSFSKATKEYIMWLDADDYITEQNIQKIIALKNSNDQADVYMFKYVMGFVDGTPTFEFFRERIVKNNSGFEWSGFVHEAITPHGKIKYQNIEIEHRKQKVGNYMRNLNLYRKAQKSGIKFTPREQYYYSRELYYNGYYKKAIKELKKYFCLNDKFTPNIVGAYLIIAECYFVLHDYQNSQKYIFESIKKFLPNAETCCMTAKIFESLHDKFQAILWYNIALITPKDSSGFVQKDFYDYIPYLELCRLYYPINFEKSQKYFLMAKKLKPDSAEVRHNSKFFKRQNNQK